MDHLWSPWRMEYILAAKEGEAEEGGCILCEIRDGAESERVLVLAELAYVVLNRFPYNPGHLMVVPNRHTGDLEDLSADETAALDDLLRRSVRALHRASAPHGFNIGMNLGRIAGAGIPDHVHWHVVPRWSGDTNFMPVVGKTRVLPELLSETYAKLRPAFEA